MSKTVMTMWLCVVGMVLGAGEPGWAAPVGTAITYQGRLTDQGNSANGSYDFKFYLYDASVGGSLLGTETKNGVVLLDGYFDVELDFGSSPFHGDARWLEIWVDDGSTGLTKLVPRQELTPTPYALYALNGPGSSGFWAANGNNIYNTNSGFVGINRSDTVTGAEYFGIQVPVQSGYGGMYIRSDGDDGWPFYGYRAGTNTGWTYLNGTTGDWHLNVDGNRLTVTDEGNVGIGTSSPVGKLHVSTAAIYSDILFVDAGSGQDDLSVDPGSAFTDIIDRLYIVEVTDSSGNPDKFKWSDDGGVTWSAELAMTTSWYNLNHGVRIRWNNTDGHDDGGGSTGDVWAWIAVSSNENALVVKEGKLVGIGTATPIWELEVANLAAGGGTESGVAANDARGAIAAYSSTLPDPYAHYGGRVSLFSDGATMGLDLRADSSGGDMRFYTGGPWPANERMRITSNGGTRITSYRDDGLGSWEEGLNFVNNSNLMGPWSHAGIWADGVSGYNGELVFGVDGDDTKNLTGIQEAMRIDKSGNVGVGTTIPGSKLEVVTTGSQTGVGGFSTSGTGVYGFSNSGYGVHGAGGEGGGYFEGSGYNTGRAYVGYGNIGIEAYGDGGGYFQTNNNSSYAHIAFGGTAVSGWGGANGGTFGDLDSSGTAYVGYGTYKIWGTGSVSFVQNHPDDADKVIVYACPEGDEVATYTRGTARLVNGKAVVPLGETFKWVTNPDIGLTAHLTPRDYAVPLAVVALTTEQLVVRGPEGRPDDVVFDYIVYGLRIGFEEVSIVQEKQREAYIPSMADHRDLYEKRSDLRQYNTLERFGAMRAALGESVPLDLTASHALRDAIVEFDPAMHELPGGGQPPSDDPDGTPTSAVGRMHEILGQKDGEIEVLRARLDALEAIVAELRNTEDGGAQ